MTLEDAGPLIAALVGGVALIGAIAKSIGWIRDRVADRHQKVSSGIRETEDLIAELEKITRSEESASKAADSVSLQRGVYRSGLRLARLIEIAEEHDRLRVEAVDRWRRRLEDLKVPKIPEAPAASKTRPTTFDDGGFRFARDGEEPLQCGHCGRLTYVGNGSRWCPEHAFEVS